jgi:hypothetical protein
MERDKYTQYQLSIPDMKNSSRFDLMIQKYEIKDVGNIESVL